MRYALVILAACGGGAAIPDAAPIADAPSVCMPPDVGPIPARGPDCMAGGIPGSCEDVTTCTGSRSPTPGACAGAADIQCCTPRFADGVQCDPNAQSMPNACLHEEPGDAGCPAGMAAVDGFCIDRFEASLAAWSPFVDPGAHAVRAVSLRGAVPQAYISQTAAAAACEASNKRLCTDAEWLRACRGAAMHTYPYGDAREPGACNDARATHPAVELYGTSASWVFSHLDSPCLNQEANGLARTGSHAACVTEEGVFDLMGNLHEWTADPAGTFRGGYYVDTVQNGDGCLYATTAHDVSYADYSTGFRCCQSATAVASEAM